MSAFRAVSLNGIVELRIHGVSGTPTTSILSHPKPVPVAGDKTAGFHRRGNGDADLRDNNVKPIAADDSSCDRHVEAYSWGRLTSGSISRAFWLLLLPFTLVNVATWAHPVLADDGRSEERFTTRRIIAALVRLLGLSLTATLVLTAIGISQNLIAWQCAQVPECIREPGFLSFLGNQQSALGQVGGRVALAAAVPLLLIVVLWWLARGTQQKYEAYPGTTAEPDRREHPLGAAAFAHRDFWHLPNVVSRLTSLHLTVALSMVAMSTAYSFTNAEVLGPDRKAWTLGPVDVPTAAWAVVLLAGLITVAAVAVLAVSWRVDRHAVLWREPTQSASRRSLSTLSYRSLPVGAGFLVLAAAVCAGWSGTKDGTPQVLPGFDGAVDLLFFLQVALVGLLIVVNTAALWNGRTESEVPWPGPAFAGYGPVVFAVVGVVLAGAFAAGLTFRVADQQGKPVIRHDKERLYKPSPTPTTPAPQPQPPGPKDDKTELIVDGAYLWYARCFAIASILALAALLMSPLVIRRKASKLEDGVRRQYAQSSPPSEQDLRRVKQIAKGRAWSSLTERADRSLGIGLVLALALSVAAYARYHGVLPRPVHTLTLLIVSAVLVGVGLLATARMRTDQRRSKNKFRLWWLIIGAMAITLAASRQVTAPSQLAEREHGLLTFLTSVGIWGIGLFALALVGLGSMAYRNQGLRRTVGILWDLGTFWPRSAHPFAPPCYCERAVPELQGRVVWRTADATDRELEPGIDWRREHEAVELSAHSQGAVIAAATILQLDDETRGRAFLITYGCPLQRLYGRIFPHYFGRRVLLHVRQLLTDGDSCRWRNGYRLTDPLGGPVFVSRKDALTCVKPPKDEVDRFLVDPRFHKEGGSVVYPPAAGHSDYLLDPGYHELVQEADKELCQRLSNLAELGQKVPRQ